MAALDRFVRKGIMTMTIAGASYGFVAPLAAPLWGKRSLHEWGYETPGQKMGALAITTTGGAIKGWAISAVLGFTLLRLRNGIFGNPGPEQKPSPPHPEQRDSEFTARAAAHDNLFGKKKAQQKKSETKSETKTQTDLIKTNFAQPPKTIDIDYEIVDDKKPDTAPTTPHNRRLPRL